MKYLNALNKIQGLGSQKMRALVSYFGEPENIWRADFNALLASNIGEKMTEKICELRKTTDPDAEWEKMQKENVRMMTLENPNYPHLLKEASNPPYIVYIKSNDNDLDLNGLTMVSIVGSRKYTSYGAQAATTFAKDLAQAGITVVSGMAIGIDALAHRGALDGGGKTIAVLGGSLDNANIYPRVNFNLACEIMDNGALISDYPIETPAGLPGNFPARNRIIAGLSLGTLVVEAGVESGTLITANCALEYGREVFSVPGSIFSAQSAGTHNLLRQGAKIVTGVKDILEELNLGEDRKKAPALPKIPENKEEEILLKYLSNEPLHIDNISRLSKLGAVSVSSALAMMEIKGWVKNIGGQNYIIL